MSSSMKKYIPLLALLSAFPPLSTDMYLPAMPMLQKQWGVSLELINVTLIIYFLTYCFFMLIYGPLSDRYGRRPPVIVGTLIYVVACIICSFSYDVYSLIFARALQGAGDAAAAVIAIAMSKDMFEGDERERVLAYIGMIIALAPMLAPVIGGWVMVVASWRLIFIMQGIIGLIACILVYRMPETAKELATGHPLSAMKNYIVIMKNKRFMFFCLSFSLCSFPVFAFVSSAPSIYMTKFGVSAAHFGFYFGINAIAIMFGAFTFTRISRYLRSNQIMFIAFTGILIGGLNMVFNTPTHAITMSFSMAIVAFSLGLNRAPVNHFLLQQVSQKETGTASAIIIASFFIVGCFSMWIASMKLTNMIVVIGMLCSVVGAYLVIVWKFRNKLYRLSQFIIK